MNNEKHDIMDMDKKDFGSMVQTHRKALGLSQDELGDMIGITRKSISCIERGECYPSPENIFKLASVLDMSLDQFVFSYEKFDTTISIDEINNMLIALNKDQQALLISIVRAICKTLTKKRQS